MTDALFDVDSINDITTAEINLKVNGQPLPAGTYFLQISGLSGTNTISAQTLVSSPVMAVGRNGVDLSLVLADGRRVTPSDVVQWVAQ